MPDMASPSRGGTSGGGDRCRIGKIVHRIGNQIPGTNKRISGGGGVADDVGLATDSVDTTVAGSLGVRLIGSHCSRDISKAPLSFKQSQPVGKHALQQSEPHYSLVPDRLNSSRGFFPLNSNES